MSEQTPPSGPVEPLQPVDPPPTSTTGWPPQTNATPARPARDESSGSTSDTAKAEAGEVKDTAVSAAQDVAATAKDQARGVVGEAGTQSRQLWSQTTSELSSQASTQQNRLADGLGEYAGQLRSMASQAEQSGPMTNLMHQVADRGEKAAGYLSEREPRDLLEDVKSFARRRPVAFLGIAAGAGIVVGRLSRGLFAEAKGGDPALSSSGSDRGRSRPPASLEEVPTSGTGSGPTYADPTYADPGYLDPTRPDQRADPVDSYPSGPAPAGGAVGSTSAPGLQPPVGDGPVDRDLDR